MRRKVQVWIFSKQGKCLLLKTNQKRGEFWQPVTGSVEKGEPLPQAALREATEETGFEFTQDPIDVQHEFRFESPFGEALEKTYAFIVSKEAKPQLDPKEHQEYQWVSPHEALALLKYPSNADGLKLSYRILFGRELKSGAN